MIKASAAAGHPEFRFLLSVLLQRESGVTLAPADRTIITHSDGAAHWTTCPVDAQPPAGSAGQVQHSTTIQCPGDRANLADSPADGPDVTTFEGPT